MVQDTRSNTVISDDSFQKMNSSEHLAEAKRLDLKANPSKEEYELLTKHLKGVPQGSNEYKDAQVLLKKVENRKDALQVVGTSWRRGAFGAAGIWTVTFHNKSDRPVGDIKYTTRYYSETGNDLGGTGGLFTTGEIQKVIPPGQKRTIKVNDGFIDREAARGNFEVTGWRVIE